MAALAKQTLMYLENLTLPSVIVVSANIGCSSCQDRVSQLLTKLTGFEEYTVDVSSRQVIVKGEITYMRIANSKKKISNPYKFIRCLRAVFICK